MTGDNDITPIYRDVARPRVETELRAPMAVYNDRSKIILDLLDVFYKNHDLFYKNSFQLFLFQINDTMQVKQSICQGRENWEIFILTCYSISENSRPAVIDDILKLVSLITDRYLGLSIYITTLGSWADGFMHYPPFGLIKVSDSHAFQLLVQKNGIEPAIELFKIRSKIVRFFSACSIHIMILIQISIIIQFSLDSEIQSYSHIKEEHFRSLLTILQSQLNILLEKLQILEERNEIHRYVYYVMKTLAPLSHPTVVNTFFCKSSL